MPKIRAVNASSARAGGRMETMSLDNQQLAGGAMSGRVASAVEYMVDAGQRRVLLLDIMRQRGDQYREHLAEPAPNVLSYAVELIIDGRKLEQPVNYALVRNIPPKGVEIDLKRRPFVVIDPRAGHGPGIGGFKADSEIGVAMKAGHPCYFIGFLPEPMPGQTIERIARAEAIFLEKVIERHPDADGKPCFIGNTPSEGRIKMSEGAAVDLRNIRSPIVVFCSAGDNITPPQQALHWILDLYTDVDEIRAYGQAIVYTVHETIGHLGIFVSGGVAKKEHAEFSSNIDLIDVLPPGLYEATFEAKGKETTSSDLVVGQWVMRCEARTLDNIRAMGGNSPEDERRFAAAKRGSEINLAAYQKFLQPWIKGMVQPQVAEMMRNLHPLRLQYEPFSTRNPFMPAVESLAEKVSEERKQVSTDNPFFAFQEQVSKQIVNALDSWRDSQEALSEATFLAVYGSPALQAAIGIDPQSTPSRRP